MGLIVTTHRQLKGLPVIYKTSIDEARFLKILHHLGVEDEPCHFQSLAKSHHANCREMLFELYDRYGNRRSG